MALLGAPVPLTGRYAVQGRQMQTGLELWAHRAGATVKFVDDASDPARAAAAHEELRTSCDIVLGPYGSDTTRAVAGAAGGGMVWNHGAAADDVQALSGVVSLPTPASGYLVALARAVAEIRPAATVVVGHARGPFGMHAAEALLREAPALDLDVTGSAHLSEVESVVDRATPDAVLLCGSLQREAPILARLEQRHPSVLLGGVSPGIADFASVAETELEGALAPVQWHADAVTETTLGPSFAEILADAAATDVGEIDYVALQAYAAALIAEACMRERPGDPGGAARDLRTRTAFGDFGLDPQTGLQRDHRLSVIRREQGVRRLHLADV